MSQGRSGAPPECSHHLTVRQVEGQLQCVQCGEWLARYTTWPPEKDPELPPQPPQPEYTEADFG